jgi:SAM-dependent methyltransferase
MEKRLDHKTNNLEQYLTAISGSLSEKTEIVQYIALNKGGRYLEIGSGGDPLAAMIAHIPEDTPPTELIAIDADPSVLEHLVARHPDLTRAAAGKNIDVSFIPMDATDMHGFEANSFDAVNASSLVHEVFSYADGFEGVRKFIRETQRILKPEGVLVYRDPELREPLALAEMEIHDEQLRAVSLFYLLNGSVDKHALNDSQEIALTRFDTLYDSQMISLCLFKKGHDEAQVLSLDDLVSLKLADVDFGKKMSITAHNGLLQEIARHYLTSHQSSPYGNISFSSHAEGMTQVNYVSKNTKRRFNNFAEENSIHLQKDAQLSEVEFTKLQEAIGDTYEFTRGKTLLILNAEQYSSIDEFTRQFGVGNFLEQIDEKNYLADSLQLSLFYESLTARGFLNDESFSNRTAIDFYTYLKQEAQELYFYLTPDEAVAVFAAVSNESDREYMLVPSAKNESMNRTVQRPKYENFLNESMTITSLDPLVASEQLIPKENKQIIHFVKMPTMAAITRLKNLTTDAHDTYHAVQHFIDNR